MWPISSGTAGAEGMSGKREIGREAAWLLFCAAAQISSSAATTRQEKSRGVPRLFSVSSVDFSCPQAHRRYAGFTRHIPALSVVLKADLSPRPAAQPVRHEDFKGLSAMDVPAVPCKAVSLGFIVDLKHFSHCRPLSLLPLIKHLAIVLYPSCGPSPCSERYS